MTGDPFGILQVGERANDAEIREAYLCGVRLHPPDRDPDGFRRVREAFEAISDRRKRASRRLFGGPPVPCLEDLVAAQDPAGLRYAGPEPWLAVLRSGPVSAAVEDEA